MMQRMRVLLIAVLDSPMFVGGGSFHDATHAGEVPPQTLPPVLVTGERPSLYQTIPRTDVTSNPAALPAATTLGGVVNIITKRSEPHASLNASGGSFGTGRGLVTYSRTSAIGRWLEPYLAVEGYNTDGYRDNQDFRRFNFFNKYTVPIGAGVLSGRVQYYSGNWGAPGYLNLEQIRAGLVSPTAAVNPTDGGHKDQANLMLNFGLGPFDQDFRATGFVNHDNFVRFADFGSGQRVQNEDRTTLGITLRKVWTMRLFETLPVQFLVGTSWRNDIVGVVQEPTVDQHPSGPPTLDVSFNEHGLGFFSQIQVRPVPWLKLTGGSRYDHFWYDINNRLAATPNSETGVWSPKVGLAITPLSWLEVFANYGEGFRSPSVVSELVTTSNIAPQKLRTQEVGFQIRPMTRFRFLADFWTTTLNRELFQPAPGLPAQDIGRSRREGFDLEARYYLLQEARGTVSMFANYTQLRTRLIDRGPSIVVPNVPQSIVNLGTDFDAPLGGPNSPHRLSGLVYFQLIGQKNLTEDGLITTDPYERIGGRLAYSHRSGWTGFLDAIWYPGTRVSETAFNFGPATGASPSDIVVSPQPPVTVLGGVSYRFRTGS